MALRNQPYLPFYVKDWLTNEKLSECSILAHGLMINIMALMHKSEEYGVILLRQNRKQKGSKIQEFASNFAKRLPFESDEIAEALTELVSARVLRIEGDKLICRRMVRDNEISEKRANAGKKGGEKNAEKNRSNDFATANAIAKQEANGVAKTQANSVIVNEYGNDIESSDPIETTTIIHRGDARGEIVRKEPDEDSKAFAILYSTFLKEYGDFGRQVKRGSIETELRIALRVCATEINPGAAFMDCAAFIVGQAGRACARDIANKVEKRLNPETWLENRCYHTDQPIEVKAKSSQPTEEEEMQRKIKRMQERRQQENGYTTN